MIILSNITHYWFINRFGGSGFFNELEQDLKKLQTFWGWLKLAISCLIALSYCIVLLLNHQSVLQAVVHVAVLASHKGMNYTIEKGDVVKVADSRSTINGQEVTVTSAWARAGLVEVATQDNVVKLIERSRLQQVRSARRSDLPSGTGAGDTLSTARSLSLGPAFHASD